MIGGEFAVKDDALMSAAPRRVFTRRNRVRLSHAMLNVLPGNLPIEIEAIFELCE